jgi:hypothetical protein
MAASWRSLAALALLAGAAFPALAQNETAPTEEAAPAPFVMPTYTPFWSSGQISRVADLLTGTWVSDGAVGEFGGSGSAGVILSIAPAPIEGLTDTLYVEAARADAPETPYRTAIYQLFEYQGAIRLRTFEMALPANVRQVFAGLWAAPQYFPQLSKDDLIATADVVLTPSADGFAGKTAHPYPTGVGGAVEMTTELSLTSSKMTVADRGFAADGSLAWGGAQPTTFVKQAKPVANVTTRDDGVVIIEFKRPDGEPVADGDRLHVHYRGYLANKTQFDASYDRDRPFIFNYPPGTRAITGWGIGMENVTTGTQRKLIVPGYLGYGDRGNPRAGIPENATLYFNTNVLLVEKAEAPAEEPAAEDHSGHDHD